MHHQHICRLSAVDRPEGWDVLCCHGGNEVGAGHKCLLPVEIILETLHKPGLWGISAAVCPGSQGNKSEQEITLSALGAARSESNVSSSHGGRHSEPPEANNNSLKNLWSLKLSKGKKKQLGEKRLEGRDIDNTGFPADLLMVSRLWIQSLKVLLHNNPHSSNHPCPNCPKHNQTNHIV